METLISLLTKIFSGLFINLSVKACISVSEVFNASSDSPSLFSFLNSSFVSLRAFLMLTLQFSIVVLTCLTKSILRSSVRIGILIIIFSPVSCATKPKLDELIEKGVGPIKDLGKITKKEFHYGLIPNEGLSRKTVYDNLILVGDTAGMANPLVLEGIRYAIKYGRVAGDTASKAIKLGDTSEEALQSYEETWKKEIDPKIKSAHKVQARWLKLSDDDWDKEIGIISNLTADEFLDFVRADFTVSKMVKLATHHPILAVRQFFNIVKGA